MTDRRTDRRTDGHPNSIGPQLLGWGLKIGGDQRLKISGVERERAIGMILGGASHNAVARHFNVHRTIV